MHALSLFFFFFALIRKGLNLLLKMDTTEAVISK